MQQARGVSLSQRLRKWSDSMNETPLQNGSHIVLSRDGTRICYLSIGSGPSVLVLPGVLSMNWNPPAPMMTACIY